MLELNVFIVYYLTMFFYIIKSRFWFVGISPKMRFDPFFLAAMWNKILNMIDIDVTQITETK